MRLASERLFVHRCRDTMAEDDSKAPPSKPKPGVSRAVLQAYVGLDATQDLILRVVMRRLGKRPPEILVDDLVSDANFACVTAKAPPGDESRVGSWVAIVTALMRVQDPPPHPLAGLFVHRHRGEPRDQRVHGDETRGDGRAYEADVLVPAGEALGQDQIVGLEAPARRSAGVLVADGDQPILPSRGQDGGRLADALRVVAVGRVEGRPLADGSVDEVRPVRLVLRIHVRLRHAELRGRVGELSQDGLAADDDDLVVVGDVGGRPDDVLEPGRDMVVSTPATRIWPVMPWGSRSIWEYSSSKLGTRFAAVDMVSMVAPATS
jgi:hypothetical protein